MSVLEENEHGDYFTSGETCQYSKKMNTETILVAEKHVSTQIK